MLIIIFGNFCVFQDFLCFVATRLISSQNGWGKKPSTKKKKNLYFNFLYLYLCTRRDFFFHQGFLSWTLTTHRTAREAGDHFLFQSTTSSLSQTLRHLLAILDVRWLSHVFNRTACIYQTANRWDLPPYRNIIWLIDDAKLVFVSFTWRFNTTFLLQQSWYGNNNNKCIFYLNRF